MCHYQVGETVLDSTATAEAILDRLVYYSHVIKINGK